MLTWLVWSIVLEVVALGLFVTTKYFLWLVIGGVGLAAVVLYLLAFRWIDRNGEWSS